VASTYAIVISACKEWGRECPCIAFIEYKNSRFRNIYDHKMYPESNKEIASIISEFGMSAYEVGMALAGESALTSVEGIMSFAPGSASGIAITTVAESAGVDTSVIANVIDQAAIDGVAVEYIGNEIYLAGIPITSYFNSNYNRDRVDQNASLKLPVKHLGIPFNPYSNNVYTPQTRYGLPPPIVVNIPNHDPIVVTMDGGGEEDFQSQTGGGVGQSATATSLQSKAPPSLDGLNNKGTQPDNSGFAKQDLGSSDYPVSMGTTSLTTVKFEDNAPTLIASGKTTFNLFGKSLVEDDPTRSAMRPIEIGNGNLGAMAQFSSTLFTPLPTIFSDSLTLSRINYYTHARFTLCVRLVVNTNPFVCGRFVLTAYPKYAQAVNPDNLIYNPEIFPCVWIDPSADSAVEIRVPFSGNSPSMMLVDSSSNATNYWGVALSCLSASVSVNGGSTTVGYTLYAWLEDIELRCPTVMPLNVTMLAKEQIKVNMNKPVSSSATAIARGFTMMSGVPILGPLAEKISGIANKIGSVANFFGWSRPTLIPDAIQPVARIETGLMPMMIGKDLSIKLSGDPLQGVPPDVACVDGPEQDQMSLCYLASIPGVVDTFTWATTATFGTKLVTLAVTPSLCVTTTATTCTPTSLAFASSLFRRWTGSLIYRFDFVSCPMVRGRVRIVHVPGNINQAAVVIANADNRIPSTVIDLAQTRKIDVQVGWTCSQPLLTQIGFDSPGDTSWSSYNGQIMAFVEVPLVNPSGALTINCIVSVRAGPDFQLLDPAIVNSLTAGGVSTLLYPTSKGDAMTSAGAISVPIIKLSGTGVTGDVTRIYGGERIVSVRDYLKRFDYICNQTNRTGGTGANFTLPYTPFVSHAALWAALTPSINYNSANAFNWVSRAYAGYRGGTRWKIFVCSPSNYEAAAAGVFNTQATPTLVCTRIPTQTSAGNLYYIWAGGLANLFAYPDAGTTISNQGVLEIEIPNYTTLENWNLGSGTPIQVALANASYEAGLNVSLVCSTMSTSTPSTMVTLLLYFAIADDFSFGRYIGPPTYNTTGN